MWIYSLSKYVHLLIIINEWLNAPSQIMCNILFTHTYLHNVASYLHLVGFTITLLTQKKML